LGPQAFALADQAEFEALVITDSLRAFLTPGLAGAMDTTAFAAARRSLAADRD
jgi:hypothetical protein